MIHLNNKHFLPPLQFYRGKVSLAGLTKKPGLGELVPQLGCGIKSHPTWERGQVHSGFGAEGN